MPSALSQNAAVFRTMLALLLVSGRDAVPTVRQTRLALVNKAREALPEANGWDRPP
jgi:hypothetical protein